MNEKIVGWIAIAVILFVGAWVYKSDQLTDRHQQIIVTVLLASALVYRCVALRSARLTVLRRRRFYKELWKRGETSNNPEELIKSKPEEESVVLLGRIRSAKPMTIVMTGAAIVALLFKANYLAGVLALGEVFLAAKLDWIARNLDRALPADSSRYALGLNLPQSTSDRYIVAIDLEKVHDFIKPVAALPFWDLVETKLWLTRCGFTWMGEGRWVAARNTLAWLDADEVMSIRPVETETE